MIYADRTFSNFESVSERKFYSKVANHLFKVSTWGWMVSNDANFINKGINSCYKVIMIDKNDEIIDSHSSLMSGVANLIVNNRNKLLSR